MKKIKNSIVSFFSKLSTKLVKWKDQMSETKVIKSINKFLSTVSEKFVKITRYNKLGYKNQKVVWSIIFLFPLIVGYCLFFLYPFISSFVYAFSSVDVSQGFATTFVGLNNFNEALRVDPTFTKTLLESTLTTFINIPVLLIFSLLIAVMINGNFRGRTFVRAVFFIPVILNSEAINIVMGNAENLGNSLNQLGNNALTQIFDMKMFLTQANVPNFLITFLSTTIKEIYSIITYSGIQILIFLAAIQSVPGHLYEAAKMEGATKYESFWKITLPMVMPMVSTALVYTVVDSFLRSPVNKILNTYYNTQRYGVNAAMSWLYLLSSLLIIGIYFLVFRKAVLVHEEDRR